MIFKDLMHGLAEISGYPLFTVAGTHVTLISISVFILIIVASYCISWILQRTLDRSLAPKFVKKDGTRAVINRLTHYTILLVGLAIGLQTVGINISALFAAGAVFAIAIGFAMQNVAQNFVSGIILLAERSIKPGDIIEVEGAVVRVLEMGIRTTVVRTWRDEDIIMPNSIFSQSPVKNYTLIDNTFRIGVEVGVSYNSDLHQVIAVLEKTARDIPWQVRETEPRVLLQDFGDSAVIFGIYLNVDDPWKQRVYMSDLRKAIWFALKDADITIAFNQMDVHFDAPVNDALAGLKKAV